MSKHRRKHCGAAGRARVICDAFQRIYIHIDKKKVITEVIIFNVIVKK